MIKVEAKNAIIALAIMSIFNEEFDYLYQNICVIINFKWYRQNLGLLCNSKRPLVIFTSLEKWI